MVLCVSEPISQCLCSERLDAVKKLCVSHLKKLLCQTLCLNCGRPRALFVYQAMESQSELDFTAKTTDMHHRDARKRHCEISERWNRETHQDNERSQSMTSERHRISEQWDPEDHKMTQSFPYALLHHLVWQILYTDTHNAYTERHREPPAFAIGLSKKHSKEPEKSYK